MAPAQSSQWALQAEAHPGQPTSGEPSLLRLQPSWECEVCAMRFTFRHEAQEHEQREHGIATGT